MKINGNTIPYIKEAYDYAKEFLITAGGQRNRRHLKDKVLFKDIEFPLEEILFDPQTSGGLLISLSSGEADDLLKELQELDLKSEIVGEVIEKQEFNIIIEKY
jgi:selenide,water dikinase